MIRAQVRRLDLLLLAQRHAARVFELLSAVHSRGGVQYYPAHSRADQHFPTLGDVCICAQPCFLSLASNLITCCRDDTVEADTSSMLIRRKLLLYIIIFIVHRAPMMIYRSESVIRKLVEKHLMWKLTYLYSSS